jgi:fructose-1-phosphate kinase PfkB-like protein
MAAGYNVVNGLPRGSTFVLSGSGPQWNQPGLTLAQTHQITGTWYAQMGAAAKARDLMFIVDVPSSGDIAVPGTLEVMFDTMNTLGVVPFAAKLNGVEASALAGRPVTSLDDKLEVAETRLKGSFFICGGNGGVLVRDPNGRAWHASVPKPSQTFSTIGSGDRTLAAFWCAIMAGKSTEEAALHAAAARMAGRAVMPGMCNAEIVREFMLHGKVKRYA